MLNKLTFAGLLVFFVFSIAAQEKSDREKSGLVGYVKSIKEVSAQIGIKNGKPFEGSRELERINTYDISGNKLTSYTYTDGGEVLYGDTYFYDEKGRLAESRTEHDKFLYLCDKETYVYDQTGKLTERNCHLNDRGIIGKTLYRYDSNGKLFEEERFPVVEAKLYYSKHSLTRYKYKTDGKPDDVSNFVRENGDWKPEQNSSGNAQSLFFSNDETGNFTQLKYGEDGKLRFVVTSLGDGKGNPLENITYYADSSIKEGTRCEYEYDAKGNAVKKIKYRWITKDGKSFFQPAEAAYFKIEYFGENEIKAFENKNKPADKPLETQILQNTDREEYAVYNALLAKWSENPEIKNIVVKKITDAQTGGDEKPLTVDYFLGPRDEKTPLAQSLAEDYNEKNFRRNSELLENLFGSKSKVILVGDDEIGALFDEGCREGWKKLSEKYPNSQGLMRFSRVGFNKDKTRALVYFGHSFACRGGAGNLFVLEKQAGGWKILNTISLGFS